METSEHFKISLYIPILDAIISELHSRFDDKNLDLMTAIKCCNPSSLQFLDFEHLQPLADLYSHLNKDYPMMEY